MIERIRAWFVRRRKYVDLPPMFPLCDTIERGKQRNKTTGVSRSTGGGYAKGYYRNRNSLDRKDGMR